MFQIKQNHEFLFDILLKNITRLREIFNFMSEYYKLSVCYVAFFVTFPCQLMIRKAEIRSDTGSSMTGSKCNLEFPCDIIQTEWWNASLMPRASLFFDYFGPGTLQEIESNHLEPFRETPSVILQDMCLIFVWLLLFFVFFS